MSSIRSILDKLAFDAMFYGQNPEGNSKPTIDQALLEISQIIDEKVIGKDERIKRITNRDIDLGVSNAVSGVNNLMQYGNTIKAEQRNRSKELLK